MNSSLSLWLARALALFCVYEGKKRGRETRDRQKERETERMALCVLLTLPANERVLQCSGCS